MASSQNGSSTLPNNSESSLERAASLAAEEYLPKAAKLLEMHHAIMLEDLRQLAQTDRESVRRYQQQKMGLWGEAVKEPDMGHILIADNITVGGQAPAANTPAVPPASPTATTAPTAPAAQPAASSAGMTPLQQGIAAAILALAAGGAGAGIPWLLGAYEQTPAPAAAAGSDTDTQYQLRLGVAK